MNPEVVSLWADIAAIFCLVQIVLVTIVMGVGLGFGWWYLRKGRKKLATPLLMGQVYALRVQHATMKVSDGVANVPITINSAVTQALTTIQTLIRF